MSGLKKWQCPHCPQDSSRAWNIRVHINRAHSGFGEPVEKGRLGRSDKSLSSDSNNSIAYRKYSPNQSKSSRPTFSYEKTSKDNEKYGDIIGYVYNFFRGLEENKYKVGEIKRIINQNSASESPGLMSSISNGTLRPNTNINTIIDTARTRPVNSLNNTDSSRLVPTHSTRNSTAGSSEATQKTTDSSFSTSDKYEKLRSGLHMGEEISPDPEDPRKRKKEKWVIKRNLMGDIIDLYMIEPDD
jgi:hypothetical protein